MRQTKIMLQNVKLKFRLQQLRDIIQWLPQHPKQQAKQAQSLRVSADKHLFP